MPTTPPGPDPGDTAEAPADTTDVARLAGLLGVAPLTEAEAALLLDLAREVAHATQRHNAPLACFLAGVAVATSPDRSAALAEVAARVGTALP